MNLDVLPALAGAFSGTACALLTMAIRAQARRQQRRRAALIEAASLACQVAPALRNYASACLAVAYDTGGSGGLAADGPDAADFTAPGPVFLAAQFAVTWKSLPCPLMVDVLTFEGLAQRQTEGLEAPPDTRDVSAFLLLRQSTYARLGLTALRLAESLHAHARLKPPAQGDALRKQLSLRLAELEGLGERKRPGPPDPGRRLSWR
ncbi:hypothetical protein BBB39_01890 [Bordetella trematum]|uniref:Uncharacterized protein n=1 Tax=Bordetella trematum TaxID=123899 RepID=A0A157RUV7_9BORD|nr:hypothetical protein [Bordetella trematum]AZR92654.1 hypothetical protein BBB39_01890 [Bordetella trematum]NNH19655.1 hypothetical protein [Bordetella trematum]QIM71250.1 hypothetical protein EYB34_07535 [Bordetella trematum]SAI54796.1 Uncharacterised protein [Bordetella trematum]SAI61800.1 Uncharacterised protein [Bordetella trematum]